MKYLISFVIGVLVTVSFYEQDLAPEVSREAVESKLASQIQEIDYTFYDNLPQSSITVVRDVYDAVLSAPVQGVDDGIAPLYYVQIGAFSKLENADSFRAQAILEGYLSADIFVETTEDIHRVMIGPFAEKHEAELAIDWASGKQFSGLLLAKAG
jgi:hypothetical protein